MTSQPYTPDIHAGHFGQILLEQGQTVGERRHERQQEAYVCISGCDNAQ